jgi:hypothetical protein
MRKWLARAVAACFVCGVVRLFGGAPVNDNFNAALTVAGTNVVANGSNVGATKEVGEPNHAGNPGGRSVWWRWTAPASGSARVQTAGSSFDTLLAIYTGFSLAALNSVAGNDDAGSLKTSEATFNVTSGVTYSIAVDGYNGATGSVELVLVYRPTPLAHASNDNFADRIVLQGTALIFHGSNFFASKEPNEPQHAEENGGSSVWWTWTPPVGGRATISTHGSDFDTLLAIYTGTGLTNLSLVASNDDVSTNDLTSLVTFTAMAKTPYQIAVDGFQGDTGVIQLNIGMGDVVWLAPPELLLNQGVKLTLTGSPGYSYAFEFSSDLLQWTSLGTLSNRNGLVQFVDPVVPSSGQRFYRAQRLP